MSEIGVAAEPSRYLVELVHVGVRFGDNLSTRRVDELIAATRDRFGVTSIGITYDMAQAFTLATRLHVLDKGRLVASGSPAARFFRASRAPSVERART